MIDAKSQETDFIYGADDKLLNKNYLGGTVPTVNIVYSYIDPATSAPDAHGRLRSMSDGFGTTTYSYVPFGSLGAGPLASVDGPISNDTISYTFSSVQGSSRPPRESYRRSYFLFL